jgi:hypothetical protein
MRLYVMAQSNTVHVTGHLDIGEEHVNVCRRASQNSKGLLWILPRRAICRRFFEPHGLMTWLRPSAA